MHTSSSRFWKIAATVPLATAAISGHAQLAAAPGEQAGTWSFHHEHLLGTSLEMTVRAANADEATRAEAAALALFDHDAAILSTWRMDSEVSRWATTRMTPVPVSDELFEVLAAYDRWREKTGGALDPSVEAATRLWKRATAEGRVPDEHEIAEAQEAMQQAHWSLDAEQRTATRLSDVPLAFASFTKSYINSRAADAALKAGATGVMLNVGGDVVVRGDLTQRVVVANPLAAAENDEALDYLLVRNRAVATSGSYRRGFDLAGAIASLTPQFSHLIDPRTAMPASHVLSSTVIAQDAVTAGALATAFSVLPVEESRRLAGEHSDVQYMLVMADGEQVSSAAWPHSLRLRDAAYMYAPAPAGAGLWDPAYEVGIDVTLPRIDDARYRRPYVAVWIEDGDHYPVRTLALWFEKTRWLPDLKQWYRDDQVRNITEGTDVSRTVSSATRAPGKYTLKWDGKDNEGKPVKAGRYAVCIEAAREHGGYDLQRQEIDFNGKPQKASLPEAKELGATTLDYRKR
jgi:thiamine biosynthesis lipoprotein